MSGRPEREAAAKAKSKILCFTGKGYRLKDGKEFSRLPPLKSNSHQHSSNSDGDIITALFAMEKCGVGEGKNHLQEILNYTMNDNQRVTHALKHVAAVDKGNYEMLLLRDDDETEEHKSEGRHYNEK